jgi:hypothetical protein
MMQDMIPVATARLNPASSPQFPLASGLMRAERGRDLTFPARLVPDSGRDGAR